MQTNTLLSFVIPCYRSEHTIGKVIEEIREVVHQREGYDFEVVAVNDFSRDNVGMILRELSQNDKRIKVINFSKNFGKHSAVLAGFAHASGDYIVTMDDDGQDAIQNLWMLVEPLEKDECDIATASYLKKKESFIKLMGHNFYKWISEVFLGLDSKKRLDSFLVAKRFVCREVLHYEKPYPFIEGLLLNVTNRVLLVPMEHRNRADDKASGFTLRKSIALFMNAVTTFSVRPLRIANLAGALFALVGFVYGVTIIIRKLINPETPLGYSSLMAVILFSSGVIMALLGIIGEYLGRIYICINNSPQYVIKDTINLEGSCGNGCSKEDITND